jgi:hypothetical protein
MAMNGVVARAARIGCLDREEQTMWRLGNRGRGPSDIRTRLRALSVVGALVVFTVAPQTRGAADYPLTQAFHARATAGATTVTSVVTVRVDRLMEENRWARVTDALKYSGYANFLNALRALPAVGAIELETRSVEIRYAREQRHADGRRLVLVSDRPLFFLGGDPAKSRAGYELTVVELRFDAQGVVTGTMAGAARVKPSPDGVQLDDYAEVSVLLTGPAGPH